VVDVGSPAGGVEVPRATLPRYLNLESLANQAMVNRVRRVLRGGSL
jgi:hypothetical protein